MWEQARRELIVRLERGKGHTCVFERDAHWPQVHLSGAVADADLLAVSGADEQSHVQGPHAVIQILVPKYGLGGPGVDNSGPSDRDERLGFPGIGPAERRSVAKRIAQANVESRSRVVLTLPDRVLLCPVALLTRKVERRALAERRR